MKLNTPSVKLPTLRETIMLALFAAIMCVSKEVLAALPNIELVSFFIILLAHNLGAKALWSVYIFVAVQGALYPFGEWFISYLYVWALLVVVVLLVRRYAGTVVYTMLSTIFGLTFGTVCSIPSFFIGGFGYGVSWIIKGLPFDIVHSISNGIVCLLLFTPLDKTLKRFLK